MPSSAGEDDGRRAVEREAADLAAQAGRLPGCGTPLRRFVVVDPPAPPAYPLALHDALPISDLERLAAARLRGVVGVAVIGRLVGVAAGAERLRRRVGHRLAQIGRAHV